MEIVESARWSGRRKAALVLSLALLGVGGALYVGVSLPGWLLERCRAAQAEAREELLDVLARQQAHRAQHGVYARSLEDLGYPERPGGRYRVRLIEASDLGFRAEALGLDGDIQDEIWRVDDSGQLRALVDACGEAERSADEPAPEPAGAPAAG